MMFGKNITNAFEEIKDTFDSKNLLNPGKLFPQPGRCAESKSGNLPKETSVLDKTKIVAAKSGIAV